MVIMSDTCVIQVTNIAPSASNEQMKTLFAFLGTIKEIVVYPNEDSPLSPTSRVCYIRFADSCSVGVAQHLTNTVFVDRALIVVPVDDGKIPDAATALSLTSNGTLTGGSNSGVISQVTGVGGAQVITTIDPRLTALGLPQYPPLPANMDPTKIEEIESPELIRAVTQRIVRLLSRKKRSPIGRETRNSIKTQFKQ